MERITGNEVQSMMEAYASVYKSEEVEQEVISEEVAETEELQENQAANRARQQRLRQQQNSGRAEQQLGGLRPQPRTIGNNRRFARRSASPSAQANTNRVGQNIKVGPITGPAQNDQLKKPAPAPAPAAPARDPNVTPGGTKFERRLPTSAELRAAQAARAAGKGEEGAIKAAVGVSKGTVADPKIAADAKRKAELAAIRAKAKTDTMSKKPAPDRSRMGGRNRMRMEEVDIFDTIKEYLIGEGATEKEALQQMITLTDEQRTEILEGLFDFLPKSKTVIPGKYGKNTVLAKKDGVEGVMDKKTGKFAAQKGGWDKTDAEKYSKEYMKQRPRGMGDPTTNHADRRVSPGRVK